MGIALSAGRGENHGDSYHDLRSSTTVLSTLSAVSQHLHHNELLRDAADDDVDGDGDEDEIRQDWDPSSLADSSSSPPHFSHLALLSGRYNHHHQ